MGARWTRPSSVVTTVRERSDTREVTPCTHLGTTLLQVRAPLRPRSLAAIGSRSPTGVDEVLFIPLSGVDHEGVTDKLAPQLRERQVFWEGAVHEGIDFASAVVFHRAPSWGRHCAELVPPGPSVICNADYTLLTAQARSSEKAVRLSEVGASLTVDRIVMMRPGGLWI